MVPVLRVFTPLPPCPCYSFVIRHGNELPVHCRVRANYLRIKALRLEHQNGLEPSTSSMARKLSDQIEILAQVPRR